VNSDANHAQCSSLQQRGVQRVLKDIAMYQSAVRFNACATEASPAVRDGENMIAQN
jgi:hypothetical protein